MERSKHTPGPWEIVKPEMLSHDAHGYESVLSPGGILGGTADEPSWVIEGGVEWEPDARLIAAAPDLLAACVEFVRKVDAGEARSTRSYAEMKTAIEKATGQK